MEKDPSDVFEKSWYGAKAQSATKPQPPPKLKPKPAQEQQSQPQPQGTTKPQPPPKLTPQEKDSLYPMRAEMANQQQAPERPKQSAPTTRPTVTDVQKVVQQAQHELMQEVKGEVLSEINALKQQFESGQTKEEDDNESGQKGPKPLPLTPPKKQDAVKAAQKSFGEAAKLAKERLEKEEQAFDHSKASTNAAKKEQKILAHQAKSEPPKDQPVLEKASDLAKKGMKDKILDAGKQIFDFWDEEPKGEKKEKDAIAKARALEKDIKSLDKLNLGLSAAGGVGMLDKGVSKGVSKGLGGNTGADFSAEAGSILSSGAALGQDLATAFTSFRAYFDTKDPSVESQCLDAGMRALADAATNLVKVAAGALEIADNAGATEVAGAVPILGIVAVIPTLLQEIYDLQDAGRRVKKQRDICEQLKDDAALEATVKSMIEHDMEEIGKGMARVCLDCTKIAGHAVTAGGITGPAGAALVAVGTVGKVLLSAGNTCEGFYDAHKANKSRKELKDIEDGKGTKDKEEVSRKLIKRDPQLASQVVIDQAIREVEGGVEDGPASQVLKSFGIKSKQIKCGVGEGDDQTVNIRNMRQLMLLKLNADDKQADTVMQKLDKAEDYLSFFHKSDELAEYNQAKDLIGAIKGGKEDRGTMNLVWKTIKTDDVVEKKKALLAQVEILLKSDIAKDPSSEVTKNLTEAQKLLQPRPVAKKDRVLRNLF